MSDIQIVRSEERYAEGLRNTYEEICKERIYFSVLQAPTVAAIAQHMRTLRESGGVQCLALSGDGDVVGWCDVTRHTREIESHAGSLGMGVLRQFRGKGLGRRLAEQTIQEARQLGIERIELGVYVSNAAAVSLYQKLGFATEGIKRRARKLDGQYTDKLMMALLLDSESSPR